ncbi:MAG: response regulator transcription factor [Pseudomonadota bacterium]
MDKQKKILIVDDHVLFRDGIKAIIGQDRSFEVVCEAGSGHEALQYASKYKPDIALVDISLPDRSGIQLTSQLKEILPDVLVLIVTMHSKIDYIIKAFQAGAVGFVVKDSASDTLLNGLRAISQGEYFMDRRVSHRVVEKLVDFSPEELKISDPAYETLTPREQEVMFLLAEGFSGKEVAKKLFISPKTIENHRNKIFKKLGIHSSVELVRYAVRLGLIDLDT